MNKGLFDLTNFESMGDEDMLQVNINEATAEFNSKEPDVNHPEADFETAGASGKETSIPVPGGDKETPSAKPADAASVTIPEGDKETPSAKPADAKSIPVPSKVTLTSDQYNNALAVLKKSFKECVDVIEILENADIVEESIEDKQEAYIESVLGDQLLSVYENGPIYEAVKREDKDAVKEVVKTLRPKIEEALKEAKIKFYKPSLVARILTGFIPSNAAAAVQQLWSTRLWQVIGICITEAANIKEVADTLTEKYESELNGYKVLPVAALPTIADVFRAKFNFKNSKTCYFLLVDKKVPKELKEFQHEVEKGIEEKEDNKED